MPRLKPTRYRRLSEKRLGVQWALLRFHCVLLFCFALISTKHIAPAQFKVAWDGECQYHGVPGIADGDMLSGAVVFHSAVSGWSKKYVHAALRKLAERCEEEAERDAGEKMRDA